ncbi:MAG TPA: hypothetical protein VFT65_01060 [Candidatus Angelobacter sp.]|nr:hypothetical protein [Candidatus Angelobacter sp.]
MPMRRAAIGIRVHSGWGALVAISGRPGNEEIIERRKVVIIDARLPGVAQPYHFAENMELRAAERHLAKCATDSKRLAFDGLREILDLLHQRAFNPVVSAILLSSARELPDLDEILGSHALIHTAEGEFFRQAFRQSLERLEVPVSGIRERDLEQRANHVFGKAASTLHKRIADLGRALGPPWTVDEKSATLAAAIALAEN